MPALLPALDGDAESRAAQRSRTLGLIERWRAIEARTRAASERAGPLFAKRGQLLPRERVARLLDPGIPFLELSTLAGWLLDSDDPEKSVPGGGVIAGIGVVSGVRVMLVADDAGIDAGALQPMGLEKLQRAQAIALENKLPFVHLIESAGANLLLYRVEQFIHGGSLFYNLARLSAAGLPVIGVVHGSSTAGGAYMTGLCDHVIMVRGRGRAFLAGPPLLKAATGEIADDEALGGADMHAAVSGLAEHVADDDASALAVARELIGSLGWQPRAAWPDGPEPLLPADDLLGAVRRRHEEAGRDAPGDRAHRRRLRLPRVRRRLRPGHGLRLCGHRRLQGRHRHQQRPARSGRQHQGHALHPELRAGGAADRLAAEHHRLHRRHRGRARRHDQARLEADPGAVERDGAADHDPVRRLVRRRQLRHVRARLPPALRLRLADRARPR